MSDASEAPEPRAVVERFLRDSRDPETGEWRVDVIRVENGKIVEHWGGIGEAQHLYGQITGAG